ncbi:hypothetical protein [Belnapia moabensis]|uniref:hypothetical protein n=1 Tax=Belnapia moabensis TaxID=365533 RepID=UPI0005B9B08F|nr:hypothetical protein [Belnapia moabensis]
MHPYFDLLSRSGELQDNTAGRYRELWRAYAADLQRFAVDAQGKSRDLWQSYFQETRAAGAGDDTSERIGAAQTNFQRAYAELEERYVHACKERQRSFACDQSSLQAEYGQRSIESLMQYLEALRTSLAQGASRTPTSRVDDGKS